MIREALYWRTTHLAGRGEREKGLDNRARCDEGHEASVEELDLVNVLRHELGEDLVGDGLQEEGDSVRSWRLKDSLTPGSKRGDKCPLEAIARASPKAVAHLGLGGGRRVAHIERASDSVLRAALEEGGDLLADGDKLDIHAERGELLATEDSLRL